jgi:hypothetical protein
MTKPAGTAACAVFEHLGYNISCSTLVSPGEIRIFDKTTSEDVTRKILKSQDVLYPSAINIARCVEAIEVHLDSD